MTKAIQRLQLFYSKLGGNGGKPADVPSLRQICLSSVGAMVGVGSLTAMHQLTGGTDATLLVASSGATAVLLFAAPALPFSQPRNVVGGHLLAASSGILTHTALGAEFVGSPAVAVGLTVFGMLATSCVHPPAGGTAIVAATASPFVIVPIFITSVAQISVACLWHNASTDGRRYPQYW
ncbi:hypothetical protein BASA81_009093 [Batrachochytrium salamandrivorans]|nr:hypothetical protein BASA81_009093 [Batrachochytrium salamandrivorans]